MKNTKGQQKFAKLTNDLVADGYGREEAARLARLLLRQKSVALAARIARR